MMPVPPDEMIYGDGHLSDDGFALASPGARKLAAEIMAAVERGAGVSEVATMIDPLFEDCARLRRELAKTN